MSTWSHRNLICYHGGNQLVNIRPSVTYLHDLFLTRPSISFVIKGQVLLTSCHMKYECWCTAVLPRVFLPGAAWWSCVCRHGCSPAGSGPSECKCDCSIDCFDARLNNLSRNTLQQVFCNKPRVALVLSTGSSIRKANNCHGSGLKLVTQQLLPTLSQYMECDVTSSPRNNTLATHSEQLPPICLFMNLGFSGITPCVHVIKEKTLLCPQHQEQIILLNLSFESVQW